MAVYSSLGALESALRQELSSAMSDVCSMGTTAALSETTAFYGSGSPRVYKRTGAYGASPRCDGVEGGGNSVSTRFYLETPGYHSTGGYSPSTIMGWIENGGPWIQGQTGRWRAFTEGDLPSVVNSAFAMHFS